MQEFSIRIASGSAEPFRCAAGDTVLGAALRAGMGFPYECNSGGCGTCQFELVEGEMADLWPEAPGIGARARERGRRLACQSVPAGDCAIKVRLSDDAVPPVVPCRIQVTFAGSRRLTGDMAEFTFQAEGVAQFVPGQFAMLRLPGVAGLRAYSMSNLPNADGLWRFIIKRVPEGSGTTLLFDTLKAGDELTLDGPYGNSYLRTGNGRDIVCIAGGSGLSPVMSILQGAVRAPSLEGRRVVLFYGGRGPNDMCASELLAGDPLLRDRVELVAAVSDDSAPGADGWTGERGLIHEVARRQLGEGIPSFDYYFCGPPPMTDAVHRMLLLEFKVPAAQLHFDRFY